MTAYSAARKKLFEVDVNDRPVPITDEMNDRWAKSVVARPLYVRARAEMGMTEVAFSNLLRTALGTPKYLAAATQVVIASNNDTWIAREQRWPEEGPRGKQAAPSDSLDWDVINREGKRVAVVALAGKARVLAITSDRILGGRAR